MSKLIYASTLQAFKDKYPDYELSDSSVYRSVVFTADAYLVTHGQIFKMGSGESGLEYAPINHADTTTKYGVGNTTNYGHVKLTDAVSLGSFAGINPETNDASTGIAATPKAIRLVYDSLKNDISNALGTSDALVFKGTIGLPIDSPTITSLPTSNYSIGWTYRVISAGIYAGQSCEIGDLITAIENGPVSGSSVINSDWTISQANIDGAVTTSTNFTAANNLILSNSANKTVKELTKPSVLSILKHDGGGSLEWSALKSLKFGITDGNVKNTSIFDLSTEKEFLIKTGSKASSSFDPSTGIITIDGTWRPISAVKKSNSAISDVGNLEFSDEFLIDDSVTPNKLKISWVEIDASGNISYAV